MGLTAKQECFKNRIIAGDSPIDAARAAYPNSKSDAALSVQAYDNLRLPKIKAAIEEHRAVLSQESTWKAQDSQRELEGAIALSKQQRQPTAIVSAVAALNKMLGLDKAPDAIEKVSIVIEQPKDYPKLNKGTG